MKVKFLSCYRGRTDENTFRAITRLRFELQTSRSHGLNRNAEIYPIRRSRAILRFWMFPGGFGGIPDRLFPQTVPPTIPPDRPPFRKLIPIVYLEGTNKYPNWGPERWTEAALGERRPPGNRFLRRACTGSARATSTAVDPLAQLAPSRRTPSSDLP